MGPSITWWAVQRCLLSHSVVLVLMVLAQLMSPSETQQLDDCPDNWFEHGGHCYDFRVYPLRTYQEASIACQQDHATIVSINSDAEHNFVHNWLSSHASHMHQWFTSGYRSKTGQLLWESDGTAIVSNHFLSDDARDKVYRDPLTNIQYNQIVYKFDEPADTWMWAWGRLMMLGAYVCEISQKDTWRLYQQRRDFSYGTGETDPNEWEMGPNITYQSEDTVFFKSRGVYTKVVLDCQASGNPRPDYRWFRQSVSVSQRQLITADLSNRYTVTNGRLTIDNPDPTEDVMDYTCEASNKMGRVLSNSIRVTHGYLGEFSNVPPSPIVATMYMGIEITCQPPTHNTDLHYTWFKRNVYNFIRPELNKQYFLSQNGHLYISEVQAADDDIYFCGVFMSPKAGQVLASTQAPSRNSLGIVVKVRGENANTYGPDIQDKFPQYFPAVPMVGEGVEIECLAYGRLPLHYSWHRDDGDMNPDAYYKDHNRVLVIPRARLEDTGSYTCTVRGDRNSANKTVHMSLKAAPRFPFPLQNQHVDSGTKVTWRCNAIAVPRPTYTWFKNGQKLTSNAADGITVNRNILTIDKVDGKSHDGMYQCEAVNSYGLARSSAQLRALSFAPSFAATPVAVSKQAAAGGNVTIACKPQAAPRPEIKWLRNGAEIGRVLPNGALELTSLTEADAGIYTCVATNALGEARSSCNLVVQKSATFTKEPADVQLIQNETAVLYCKASFDRSKTDIIYVWKFNSHIIDFTSKSNDIAHYSMPFAQTKDDGMLYIHSTQFEHEGEYTCMVTTVTGSIGSSAYVTVKGPPGEPGGVHARQPNSQELFHGDVELWWQEGLNHGFPVTKYAIEYQSYYEDRWRLLAENIPDSDVHLDAYPDWRGYKISEGLSPGTAYKFRVRAGNSQTGYGPASAGPYKWYTMTSAPPIYAPGNVGGGGGSVGEFHITWDPLPRSLWGGESVVYQVYYREKDERDMNRKWETSGRQKRTVFNTVVGQEKYYLPYEVKVQAINEKGSGPNSSIAIVYSAEDMPTNIAPTFLQANAINATAGIVEWQPVPDTREGAKGTVFAYQVNYWKEGDTKCEGKYEDTALFIRFYGQVSSGMLVGMDYGDDYCLNLQFLNHAGMGPKTDNYYLGMNDAPPGYYPEYVTVASNGNESVRLMWRGISTVFGEDPLRGYKAWWWDAREDIRAAQVTDFGKTSRGVIHGVEKDVVYKLRMMGYSTGGDGKKSQDIFFTLGGMVEYDPVTTEVMNTAPAFQFKSFTTLGFLVILTFLFSDVIYL